MACILVVDDEEMVRTTLRQMLEKAGHGVIEATNGQEALDVFKGHKVDLVITDIIMPEKAGIETIIELRRLKPDVKIIAISGGGRTGKMEYLSLAKRLGAQAILRKPFRMREVLEVVDKTVAGANHLE